MKFIKFLPIKKENLVILDCRSPLEYKDDHPRGCINTPVLNNEEREEVGTIYKQDKFKAKKLGAKYITKNISKILDDFEFDHKTNLILYCARGGQRSQSLATVLAKIGYNVEFLEKGYKSYRNQVLDYLKLIEFKKLYSIYGKTGSGKTILLKKIKENGGQILDLEECALHRGSILGSLPNIERPSQKQFETNLYYSLNDLDFNKPVFIEGESRHIGRVSIPNELWKYLMESTRIYLNVTNFEERIKHIREEYKHFETLEYRSNLEEKLKHLEKSHLMKYIENNQMDEFVKQILETHYDILYQKDGKQCDHEVHISKISEESLDQLSKEMIEKFQ